MLSFGLLGWLSHDQNLLALLSRDWLLGLALVALAVFLETGIVVLPFLPGDTLLFATGAFVALSKSSPLWPVLVLGTAAIAGDFANYAIGRSRLGQQIIARGWISPRRLAQTHRFFEAYGGPAVTIGRFVPVVRTVVPFFAGLAGMPMHRFLPFNMLGGAAWGSGLTLAGFWLGENPWVRAHLTMLSMAIVVASIVPLAWHALHRATPREENDT